MVKEMCTELVVPDLKGFKVDILRVPGSLIVLTRWANTAEAVCSA
jgi:hypothetical protein